MKIGKRILSDFAYKSKKILSNQPIIRSISYSIMDNKVKVEEPDSEILKIEHDAIKDQATKKRRLKEVLILNKEAIEFGHRVDTIIAQKKLKKIIAYHDHKKLKNMILQKDEAQSEKSDLTEDEEEEDEKYNDNFLQFQQNLDEQVRVFNNKHFIPSRLQIDFRFVRR